MTYYCCPMQTSSLLISMVFYTPLLSKEIITTFPTKSQHPVDYLSDM